jgi:tRNA 5-methylaminomethyl-2-thiouridine biosynthesis bifunctional protein
VVGGGLAGCAAANALAARGQRVILLEAGTSLASGASGNSAGALYPLLTAAPSQLGDYYANAFRYTLKRLPELARLSEGPLWHPCGVLLLPKDAASTPRFAKIAARPELQDIVQSISADDASAVAGIPLRHGGLLLPQAGWVRPPLLCAALIAEQTKRITVQLNTPVADVRRVGALWHAVSPRGVMLATAPHLVLATAAAVKQFAATAHVPVRPNRGQLTLLPATAASQRLRAVVCQQGYLLPAIDGQHMIGATYARGETNTTPRPSDTADNLAKATAISREFIESISGTDAAALAADILPARVAIRATTPDHLPIAGPVDGLPGLSVLTGLGSRGLTTALWAAQNL